MKNMKESLQEISISLPEWLMKIFEENRNIAFNSEEERMNFVIELSRMNIEKNTGGPFGAAIFSRDTHRLISVGVNRVIPENISLAHAEVMAILMGEKIIESYDFGSVEEVELVTSSQPCIQCYGAILWAGIHKIVIGARGEDVKSITGFDEGPLPENWIQEMNLRGVEVVQDILRDKACIVLEKYAENGIIYNSSTQVNQKIGRKL